MDEEVYEKEIKKFLEYPYRSNFLTIEGYFLGGGDSEPMRSKKNILKAFQILGTVDSNTVKEIEDYFDFLQWLNPNETIWVTD